MLCTLCILCPSPRSINAPHLPLIFGPSIDVYNYNIIILSILSIYYSMKGPKSKYTRLIYQIYQSKKETFRHFTRNRSSILILWFLTTKLKCSPQHHGVKYFSNILVGLGWSPFSNENRLIKISSEMSPFCFGPVIFINNMC